MKTYLLAAVALTAAMPQAASAAPADDAVAAVTTWLDKFNAGDMQAFFAGHTATPVLIDEFPPYIWSGKDAPQSWAQAFGADAKAHGITEPHMDHGAPLRAESDGSNAYIVIPTVYHAKQNGKAMSAKGSMTFVMTHGAGGWKIASWTYAAPASTPDR